MAIQRKEIYKLVDGINTLIEVIETEVNTPTTEEIIAEKEAELISIYNEIQKLKEQ